MRWFSFATSVIVVPLVAVATYAVLDVLYTAPETAESLVTSDVEVARRFSPGFAASPEATKPPRSSYNETTHAYNFGRYTRPIPNANHHPVNPLLHVAQDKSFVWIGITQGFYHISIGLLQFHYTSAAVYSVYDSHVGLSWSLYRDLPFPLSKYLGPAFNPNADGHSSAIAGCVNHTEGSGFGSICFDERTQELVFSVEQVLKGDTPTTLSEMIKMYNIPPTPEPMRLRLHGTVTTKGFFPTMVMPLGGNRAATVSKFAARLSKTGSFTMANAATGELRISATLDSYSMVSLDHTRGLLRRETKWRWATFSEYLHADANSFPYGMHISTDTYDFGAGGVGLENSVYGALADGTPSFRFLDVAGVKIEKLYPAADPHRTPWLITGPNKLNLTFTPHGGRFHGSIHLKVVDAEMSHMWGTFRGTAPMPDPLYGGEAKLRLRADRDHVVIKAPGVLEDHYALW